MKTYYTIAMMYKQTEILLTAYGVPLLDSKVLPECNWDHTIYLNSWKRPWDVTMPYPMLWTTLQYAEAVFEPIKTVYIKPVSLNETDINTTLATYTISKLNV